MKQEPFEIGNYYHVFNRINNKENIFKEKENYSYFIMLIEKYLIETCQIYAFCLLPNHFHLLLKIKDFDNLPEAYRKGNKKIHQPFLIYLMHIVKLLIKDITERVVCFKSIFTG